MLIRDGLHRLVETQGVDALAAAQSSPATQQMVQLEMRAVVLEMLLAVIVTGELLPRSKKVARELSNHAHDAALAFGVAAKRWVAGLAPAVAPAAAEAPEKDLPSDERPLMEHNLRMWAKAVRKPGRTK
jgi:hypothetical protein